MNNTAQIKSLCTAFGWVDLGPQEAKYMLSFKHEENKDRLNIYYTSATVTIQAPKSRYPQVWRDVTLDRLESILQTGGNE